jgi:hypothetical protein
MVLFLVAILSSSWIEPYLPETLRKSLATWSLLLVLACIFFVVGAMPVPWVRHQLPLGMAAFAIPLSVLGWITWRIEYFMIFEHSGAWENLPRVILSPENLAVALGLSITASLGWRLSVARRARTNNRAA